MESTGQMWDIITRMARFSHSIASGNQRLMSAAFNQTAASVGEQNASMNDSINANVKKSMAKSQAGGSSASSNVDANTGKVVNSSG